MPEMNVEDLPRELAHVATDANAPRVIFPYGFKIVEFEGENVLCPLTPAEYKQAAEADGYKFEEDALQIPRCVFAQGGCVSQGCYQQHGSCQFQLNDTLGVKQFYCICNY